MRWIPQFQSTNSFLLKIPCSGVSQKSQNAKLDIFSYLIAWLVLLIHTRNVQDVVEVLGHNLTLTKWLCMQECLIHIQNKEFFC